MSPFARTCIVAAILLTPLALPAYYKYLATELVIWGLLAVSLDLLIGFTGLPSFGHAVFFGVPAYVFGIVATRSESLPISILAAIAGIAAVTCVVGYFGTKTGGVGYIIVTLLCSFAVFIITLTWTSVTGGENGLYVPEALSLAGLSGNVRYLLVAAIGVAIWLWGRKLVSSNYGLVLLGIKANEPRMQAIGYNTERYKFQITVIAGAIAGVAGILYALVVRTLSADLVGPELSTEVVIWVLLGGVQTLTGPVLGAALFISLKQVLNTVSAYPIFLGLLFVAVVAWAPTGLIKLRFSGLTRSGKGQP
ncbi:MAG: branched-chain amino acid ABC transporter permease [Burkholderiales bacterium]|nr:branched-chain amino acid ABC transporter permease [Burkholderiales bacterium]